MERVSTIKGNADSSAIILVPHGHDDPNTSVIAEEIIAGIGAYGVINRGWERADSYDYYKDKANCNNIDHIHEDVVKDEFLDPILNYVDRIMNAGEYPNVFIIHGVSNTIRKQVGGDALDLIIGYGEGTPPSHSCDLWYKDAFMYALDKVGFRVYQGKAGGNYSARRKQNLNQLFRQWDEYFNEEVFSTQIEVIRELRDNEDIARLTGDQLGLCINELIELRREWDDDEDSIGTLKFPTI